MGIISSQSKDALAIITGSDYCVGLESLKGFSHQGRKMDCKKGLLKTSKTLVFFC
jgi:hypothetical protein